MSDKLYTYLLVFDDAEWTKDQVQKALREMKEARYWFRCLPGAVFVTSAYNAQVISTALLQKIPDITHIILDCKTDYWGKLDKRAWKLIADPSLKNLIPKDQE